LNLNKASNFILFILSFLLFCSAQSSAQVLIDSSIYFIPTNSLNRLYSDYDKLLNTYYLNTGIDLYGSSSGFEYVINQNFRSTLIISNENSIRDEEFFYGLGKYRIRRGWKQGLLLTSSLLSDSRQLGINKSAITQAILLSDLQPLEWFTIVPYGGYSNNLQVDEDDTGPVYGFQGRVSNLHLTDFNLNTVFKFENEDISPRKNTIRYLDLLVTNPFTPDVTNFLNAKYSRYRKDFYLFADSVTALEYDIVNNLESRIESIFLLQDKLRYNDLFNFVDMELSGRILFRTIDRELKYKTTRFQSPSIFDTQVEELGIFLESSFYYTTGSADVEMQLSYFERDEKYITKRYPGGDENFYQQRSQLEGRKNNNSYRGIISLLGNFYFSDISKLSWSFFQSKLKYDTPSPLNDDDRDELLSIARLRYSTFVSPFLQISANLEGTLSHLVYLYASKSANNNVNRVIRLSTGVDYRGARFSSSNTFEVSANYTVYDFEDIATNLRSIAFRQFFATDSTEYKITKNFSFIITPYIRLTDQGELNWDEFAERPQRYLQEFFADPRFGISSNFSFFALGIRYFSLSSFQYVEGIRVLGSEFQSIGPLFEILIKSQLLFLKLNTWYEFISDYGNEDKERLSFLLTMNWNF
jgi:hypothetical protein